MSRTSTSIQAVCAALLLSGFSTGSALADTPCQQWDARGFWQILQGGFTVRLESIDIVGQNLTGDATYLTKESMRGPNGQGPIDGTITGESINFRAYWSSGAVGVYNGTIGPTGRVSGITYEESSPTKKMKWHSAERLTCLESASATPSPPAKKSKVLGKKKPAFDPKKSSLEETGQIAPTVPVSGCKPGFVERLTRPEDNVCVFPEARARIQQENDEAEFYIDPAGAYGPNSCMNGYVWRDAYNGDGVCVTPEARETANDENRSASSNRIGG